jgi:hypothetical protein
MGFRSWMSTTGRNATPQAARDAARAVAPLRAIVVTHLIVPARWSQPMGFGSYHRQFIINM